MKKGIISMKKRMIAAGLLAITMMSTAIPVSAAEVCTCIKTGQAAGVVCYQCNKAKRQGTKYTHTYGFLWMTQGTCTITPYMSNSREYCNKCNFTYRWCGEHECEVSHNGCGKGKEDVCQVMSLSPGDVQKPTSNGKNQNN